MKKVLRRRVLRELLRNKFRYGALAMLIVCGMYLVVSLVGAAETVITGVDKNAEKTVLEDGQFTVFAPLKKAEQKELTDGGIILERKFSLDFADEKSDTIRVFKNRKNINLTVLDEGRKAEKPDEILLEKRYAWEHGLKVGGKIKIAGITYDITGIGSVPDYDAMYKNMSDSSADSQQFGLAFVCADAYKKLKNTEKSIKSEDYVYAYRRNGSVSDHWLKKKLKNFKFQMKTAEGSMSYPKLVQFIKASDNPRLKASAEDQIISRNAGLLVGILVMILFTYVISVFVIHGIEKESSEIGTLYALGVRKRELIHHYLTLPVWITLAAALIGTAAGFSRYGINIQLKECYQYFSIPEFSTVYPIYLVLYGVFMPLLTAILVNLFVIHKKLSIPALKLLRKEQKSGTVKNISLKKIGFMGSFRIRQMLREARTGFTVILGLLLSLLITLLAFDCYVMCSHVSVENKEDTKFEYFYTYKYPPEKVPVGGEGAFAKNLSKDAYGFNQDITVLGIRDQNPYFEVDIRKGKNELTLSSAMAQKFHLKVGDKVILKDKEDETDHEFGVNGIMQYSVGLYAFMDLDSMRQLFGKNSDFINVALSDKKLDIDSDKIFGVTTREQIIKSSDVFMSMMSPMIGLLSGVSVLIFVTVMYLMMKMMIERSSFSISLMKIFGYRTGEIRRMYLNGNFYLIAVSSAVCLPLAKHLIDTVFPLLVANVSSGMNLTFTWQQYLGLYLCILLLYLIINQFLVISLKKMTTQEILKNRE